MLTPRKLAARVLSYYTFPVRKIRLEDGTVIKVRVQRSKKA